MRRTNFNLVLDQIVDEVTKCGFDFALTTGHPFIQGLTWVEDRRIEIQTTNLTDATWPTVLFICAHELRHAQHCSRRVKRFRDHYDPRHVAAIGYILHYGKFPRWMRLPSLAVAYRAEMDCNEFAARFLARRGIDFPQSMMHYVISNTQQWDLHVLVASVNPGRYGQMAMRKSRTRDVLVAACPTLVPKLRAAYLT